MFGEVIRDIPRSSSKSVAIGPVLEVVERIIKGMEEGFVEDGEEDGDASGNSNRKDDIADNDNVGESTALVVSGGNKNASGSNNAQMSDSLLSLLVSLAPQLNAVCDRLLANALTLQTNSRWYVWDRQQSM
jgi:hypothetical protein